MVLIKCVLKELIHSPHYEGIITFKQINEVYESIKQNILT